MIIIIIIIIIIDTQLLFQIIPNSIKNTHNKQYS